MHGARALKSLQEYPRAYCVIAALVQTQSPIFAGHVKQDRLGEGSTPMPASAETATTQSPQSSADPAPSRASQPSSRSSAHTDSTFIKQWNALDDALDNGVISKGEYDRKLSALMAKNRAAQQTLN